MTSSENPLNQMWMLQRDLYNKVEEEAKKRGYIKPNQSLKDDAPVDSYHQLNRIIAAETLKHYEDQAGQMTKEQAYEIVKNRVPENAIANAANKLRR